jgi:uncharacterized protein GlcG (DUF336 family)
MTGMTLCQAQALCAAALRAGRAAGAPPLAVAVLDARASIKALCAEDGLGIAMPQIAVGKANAVLALGIDGTELATVSEELPGAMSGFVQLAAPFVAVKGGLLVRDANGVIGAIGVTGDTAERDEQYARAAFRHML